MKFPSFIKVPRNKRFNIEPRYYDPIKEEIEERTMRIKQELEGKSDSGTSSGTRITFERRTSPAPSSSLMQLGIAAILGSLVIGWLFYGNAVFYSLWLVVPIYLFFRFRKNR